MNSILEPVNKKRKYVGIGGDGAPSLGVLEGDILRLLWDAGEPQSSVQVYQSMTLHRKDEKREMQSPSTIAVTLSRMVEKGLLQIERRPNGGKGYYGPTRSRADIVAHILDDVSERLTGKSIGFLLSSMLNPGNPAPMGLNVTLPQNDSSLEPLFTELRRRLNESSEVLKTAVVKKRE